MGASGCSPATAMTGPTPIRASSSRHCAWPRNRRHIRPRNQRVSHNPGLLVIRPRPVAARSTAEQACWTPTWQPASQTFYRVGDRPNAQDVAWSNREGIETRPTVPGRVRWRSKRLWCP